MGKILGSVTDAFGLTDNKGQEQAAKNAAQAQGQSYALTKEQIAFMKEQYNDWKAVYGDVQDNLGEYYKNLGEDRVMALGLTNNQKEFQAAKLAVQQDLAQRGLGDSPVAAGVMANAEFQNASVRGQIRSNAPEQVAQAKLGFLGVGLNQGTALVGQVGNAYSTGVQSATNMAGQATQQYTQLSSNNTSAMQSMLGTATGYTFGFPGAK